jgi:D-sedoheptulose 7-phosphate isomerase
METAVNELVRAEIENTVDTYLRFKNDEDLVQCVTQIGQTCAEALGRGNKIMLIGNGGSAADSQHIAAEFVSRLAKDRCPLPALALTTDTSILTAAANDYGYEQVFSRQVTALGRQGDVLIGISTSGKSPNVLLALKVARQLNIITVGLTGASADSMATVCDHLFRVPSSRTQNIQEVHIMVGHTICAIAEQAFLPAELTQAKGAEAP